MKRKIVSLLFTLVFLISCVTISTAQNNIVDSMDLQGAGIELTLAKAVETALKDNPEIAKVKLDNEQVMVDYEKDKNSLDDLRVRMNSVEKASLEYIKFQIRELSVNYQKDSADRNYNATVERIKAEIEQAYYNVLQAGQVVKINKDNLEVSKKLFDTVKKKFELGLVSKVEVLNSEQSFIKAENDYISSENSLKSATMLLNTKLGMDVMTKLTLKDELSYKEYKLDNIAKSISQAFANRSEIKALDFANTMETFNMKVTAITYPDFTYPYRKQVVKTDKAMKDLENMRKTIELEVRTNYMDIQQKQAEIKSGQKSVELAEEALKLSQLTFDNGMGVQTDVQKAQVSLQQAKLGLSKAILDYNLAVLKFEDSIGVGRTKM